MKIKVLSDLHMEFWRKEYVLPSLYRSQDDTVLVIAGDLHVGRETMAALGNLKDYYRAIVYVPGNHEYYGHDLEILSQEFSNINRDRIYILKPGSVTIENIHFIGATLWTDLAKGNIAAMDTARDNMSDFYLITSRGKRLSTLRYRELHKNDLEYLESTLPSYSRDRTIVVTHHMPSYRCIHENYAGNPLNPAFASDLDWLIKKYKPIMWVHGHTHSSLGFTIGETKIICNPFGYWENGLNPEFESSMVFDV